MQSIKSYNYLYYLILILLIIIFSIKNIGRYLDITETPKKADVILYLGGDDGKRAFKIIELLKKGMIIENKVIITEKYKESILKKTSILKQNKINTQNIISTYNTSNTYQELVFAKKIMKEKNFKSILIVSTGPHSRRIKILIDNFINIKNENIKYILTSDDTIWWNKKTYYKNKKAIQFVLKESIKILYNYIFYNLKSFFNINENVELELIKIRIKIFKILNI